jgi:hypothetical protein
VTQGKAGMSRARCLRDGLSVLVVRVWGMRGLVVPCALCVCAGGLDGAYNFLTSSLSPRPELGRVPRRVLLLLLLLLTLKLNVPFKPREDVEVINSQELNPVNQSLIG